MDFEILSVTNDHFKICALRFYVSPDNTAGYLLSSLCNALFDLQWLVSRSMHSNLLAVLMDVYVK